MKTIYFYIMLILFFICEETISQGRNESVGSIFGFNAGISHYQVKERNLNGLVHRGPGFNTAAVYENYSAKLIQRLELMIGVGFLKTGFEEEGGTFLIHSSLSYQYDRLVAVFNDRWGLYLGGMAGLGARQGIYENWDENHFYWLTSYSLGFNTIVTFEFSGRSGISFETSTPLLSLISRTPRTLQFHEASPEFRYVIEQVHQDLSLEILPKHFSLELKAAYHLKLRGNVKQTFFWRMNYLNNRVSSSGQLKLFNHTFGIEFLF